MNRSLRSLALFLALLGAPAPALAQPVKDNVHAAQKLFEEGLALMKAGKYAEACPRFQESQKLDPGMGTKFRLAECYEAAGWVGSAWQMFGDVAEDAKKAGRADREAQARQRVTAIQARVPWMTLVIPAAVAGLPGLEVKRDGELVAPGSYNRKVAIDPGAHTVTVAASGKKPWQETVRVLEGGTVELSVPALEDDGAQASPPSTAPPDVTTPPAATTAPTTASPATSPGPGPSSPAPTGSPPDSGTSLGRGQRIAAVVTGVVGLGGIAMGAAFGAMARSRWDEALSGCAGGDPTRCNATAIDDGKSASKMATVSTVGFVAGGAVVAGAVILFLTAPTSTPKAAAWQIVPAAGPGTVSGVFQGKF
jgi:hypothetical protein